jgi:hypothetical protein
MGRVVCSAVYTCCVDILARLPAFRSTQAPAFLLLPMLMPVDYGVRQERVLRY